MRREGEKTERHRESTERHREQRDQFIHKPMMHTHTHFTSFSLLLFLILLLFSAEVLSAYLAEVRAHGAQEGRSLRERSHQSAGEREGQVGLAAACDDEHLGIPNTDIYMERETERHSLRDRERERETERIVEDRRGRISCRLFADNNEIIAINAIHIHV